MPNAAAELAQKVNLWPRYVSKRAGELNRALWRLAKIFVFVIDEEAKTVTARSIRCCWCCSATGAAPATGPTNEMDTMDGLSMDLERANLDKLRAMFSECFAEGKLDIDKLLGLCEEYIDNHGVHPRHQPHCHH